MKKNKRLLSLCLGLVLVLGVTACDDLGDILGDLGSDEPDISTELEEQDEDDNNKGNDDTSESNISYTYSVSITNGDELTPLVVEGDTVTAKVELVTTTHNRVTHDVSSSSEDATAEDVTLESSVPGILEIEGLTINPIAAGTTTLTAYWEEHDATSSGLEITVSEPDSYTYVLTINNKESYTDLTTESNLEDVSITLTTYKNGEVEGTPETGSSETVSLVSSDTSVISVESGSLSLTVVGAGDTIITAYWIGHEEEASDTIAITVSEPTSGGDEGGGSGGQGGDTGGGSGEGGDTGGEEPGGDEPEIVYISSLTFDKETYTLDMTTDTTATFTVTTNSDASDPTAYTVTSKDTSVATVSGNTITAVGVGETKIIAMSTDNATSPVYGCASVTVSKGYTVIESFSLSQESITLDVGESASIGYAGEQNPTVTVTYVPSDARNSAFTLTGEVDDYLTISERGENNIYTITASDTPDDAGSELKTYTLTLSSDDEESDASASLTVIINDIEAKSHPVTDLTLSSYEKVIAHDGSFTIGPAGSEADIIASVNEGAYDSSINVTTNDGYLTVDGPDENGVYTITANVSDDNSVTSSVTVGTANPGVSQTITVTIERAEDRITDISINPTTYEMETDSTFVLGTEENPLEVTITNQYGEKVDDAEWTASISADSGDGVLESVSVNDGLLTIVSGLTTGTGKVDISATGEEGVTPAVLTLTVSQHYYEVQSIQYSGSSEAKLEYNLANTPEGTSVTINDNDITYNDETHPINDEYKGYTLVSEDTTHISINNETHTITAVKPTEDGEPALVYIKSTSNTDVVCATPINITVSDVTEYGVTGLSVTATTTEIKAGETKTLAELGVEVIYTPTYTTELEYTVTSSNEDVLAVTGTYSEGYSLTASSGLRTDTEVTLTFKSTSNEEATATLSIKVTNDYVAVESVSLNASTLSLTYGGEIGNTATITATVNPYNATDAGVITWSSSNTSAVTISGEGAEVTLTAVGTGTSEITATCGGVTSNACTVTVTEVFRSYTVVISLKDVSGNDFEDPYDDYGVYLASEYDGTGGGSWGDYHQMKYDETSKTYSYTFDTLPTAGSYYTYVCAGNEDGYSYLHKLGEFYITVTGEEQGDYTMPNAESITCEYTDWSDVFPAIGDNVSFYLVLLDSTTGQDKLSSWDTSTNSVWFNVGNSGEGQSANYFDGETYCEGGATKTKDGTVALYSKEASGPENAEFWANVTCKSAGMNLGTTTIHADAVYIAAGWLNGWSSSSGGYWNADVYGDGWYSLNGKTITEFLAEFAYSTGS